MSVRRPHGTTGRSPDSIARRSRVAKRGHRYGRCGRGRANRSGHPRPAEERRRGGVGDIERFLPEGGGERPRREGGLHPGTGSADSSSRATSTSGWTPVGPRSASSRRCAMLRPKGRILYDSSEGVLGNPAKGTRLRSGAGVAVPVRRPHGTTRRSPNTLPRRSRVAKRGGRAAEAGGAGRTEAAAHTRPRNAEGAAWGCRAVPSRRVEVGARYTKAVLGAGSADSSSRATSTSGWTRAAPESRGPRPLDGALCSAPRAVSSTTRAKGCLETQPKGTRLRSSGRLSGACPAAPWDYQAQPQLTCSAEPSCETRPLCGRRRSSLRGRSTPGRRCGGSGAVLPAEGGSPLRDGDPARPHGGIHRAAPASGGGPVHEGAIPGRGRFPQNGPPPSDFNDRFEGSGGSEMVALRSPLPGLDGVLCFASRAASSTTRAKGCLET